MYTFKTRVFKLTADECPEFVEPANVRSLKIRLAPSEIDYDLLKEYEELETLVLYGKDITISWLPESLEKLVVIGSIISFTAALPECMSYFSGHLQRECIRSINEETFLKLGSMKGHVSF